MTDAKAEKQTLRATVLAARDAIPVDVRTEAAARVCSAIRAAQAYQRARAVLAYASFGGELPTDALLKHALSDGKILVLPRVDKAAGCLRLHLVRRLDDLVAGGWGIREPQSDSTTVPSMEVDLIVVPGVAFDRAGFRIGYGGGYYDKLLPLAKPETTRVSGVFDCQIVDAVPNEIHDQRVDLIITPTQKILIAHDRQTH
jgi:5-formyltetrahydrofolate cyclo-ligase